MAERPVFTPSVKGPSPVWTHSIDFQWFPGMSLSQSQKSITSLHQAAQAKLKVDKVLEISSKSKQAIGVKLSAFNLMITTRHGREFSVESAYQSSKVFERDGPFPDLLDRPSIDAKRDPRLKESGRLLKFKFFSSEWPLEPETAFYDWLYINALLKYPDLAAEVLTYRAFTDIAFNPERSRCCQAYAAALYVSLHERGLLSDDLVRDKDAFLETMKTMKVSNTHRNNVAQPGMFDEPDETSSAAPNPEPIHEPPPKPVPSTPPKPAPAPEPAPATQSEPTARERLADLEKNFKLLASVVSRQAGELQALNAAFHGFLIFAGDVKEVRQQIELQLEKCTASNLGSSTNPDLVDAFEEAANLLRLAMDSMAEHRANGDRDGKA
jgi:hypothetical protein